MAIKIIPLKTPSWTNESVDVPSLLDVNNDIKLVEFIQNNLYNKATNWVDDLTASPDRQLIYNNYLNRTFNYETTDINLNYFVSLENNRYMFWFVTGRVVKNNKICTFNVEVDTWLTVWNEINLTTTNEVYVKKAHSNRAIPYVKKDGTTIYIPCYAKMDNVLHNYSQQELAYNHLIPKDKILLARDWGKIDEPPDTPEGKEKLDAWVSNYSSYTVKSKGATFPLEPTYFKRNRIGEPNWLLFPNGFINYMVFKLNEVDKNDISFYKGLPFPFLVMVVPMKEFKQSSGLDPLLVNAFNNCYDLLTDGSLSRNINLVTSFMARSGVESLLSDDLNLAHIPLHIDDVGIGDCVYFRPNAVSTSFGEQTGELYPVSIDENIKFNWEWTTLINSQTQNMPYVINREPKLFTSPFYNYEYSFWGSTASLVFKPEYWNNVDHPITTYQPWYDVGNLNYQGQIFLEYRTMIFPNNLPETVFCKMGIYRHLALTQEVFVVENSALNIINTKYFANNSSPLILPSVTSQYEQFIQTSQNGLQAGYIKSAFGGSFIGTAIGQLIGGQTLENVESGKYTGGIALGSYALETTAHLKDLKNSPDTISQTPTVANMMFNSGSDVLTIFSLAENDRIQLYLLYYLEGYVWERKAIFDKKLIGSRYWFNFIKVSHLYSTLNKILNANFPIEILQRFSERLAMGIRLWHSRVLTTAININDLSKENLEMDYIVNENPTEQLPEQIL